MQVETTAKSTNQRSITRPKQQYLLWLQLEIFVRSVSIGNICVSTVKDAVESYAYDESDNDHREYDPKRIDFNENSQIFSRSNDEYKDSDYDAGPGVGEPIEVDNFKVVLVNDCLIRVHDWQNNGIQKLGQKLVVKDDGDREHTDEKAHAKVESSFSKSLFQCFCIIFVNSRSFHDKILRCESENKRNNGEDKA